MPITITAKKSRNKEKTWYTFEWGKHSNERKAAGIFTYTRCKDLLQKNHNKEALALLDTKKSHLILEQQSTGTVYIPNHKFKTNFLDYFEEFVKLNKRPGNRHLEASLTQFKKFIGRTYFSHVDLTENLCIRYQKYLLERFTGKSPSDYFQAFKRVVKTAMKEGYFRINPAEDVRAKKNPSKKIRQFLEVSEYIKLMQTPIYNQDIKEAFVVSCYTGLRWCDVSKLTWDSIGEGEITTQIIQAKTGLPVTITMHPIVKTILHKRRCEMLDNKSKANSKNLLFRLPTANGCNKTLKTWMITAGINKHITWHCARLSFSILLQDANVDTATVALLLGHTTSRFVHETYKRFRPKDQSEHLDKLPAFDY